MLATFPLVLQYKMLFIVDRYVQNASYPVPDSCLRSLNVKHVLQYKCNKDRTCTTCVCDRYSKTHNNWVSQLSVNVRLEYIGPTSGNQSWSPPSATVYRNYARPY